MPSLRAFQKCSYVTGYPGRSVRSTSAQMSVWITAVSSFHCIHGFPCQIIRVNADIRVQLSVPLRIHVRFRTDIRRKSVDIRAKNVARTVRPV